MGLDTSHDCWHGAYSAFHVWREKLAEVAGYPSLLAMEGFFRPDDWWFVGKDGLRRLREMPDDSEVGHAMSAVFLSLPISWKLFESDPLSKILCHSDCDGSIASEDCGPIADRLTELLPLLPDVADGGHIGVWRDKTQQFIDGLRAAAAAGEDVEFH